jgi:hypothetical protein
MNTFEEWSKPSLHSECEGIREEFGRQEIAAVKEGSPIGK